MGTVSMGELARIINAKKDTAGSSHALDVQRLETFHNIEEQLLGEPAKRAAGQVVEPRCDQGIHVLVVVEASAGGRVPLVGRPRSRPSERRQCRRLMLLPCHSRWAMVAVIVLNARRRCRPFEQSWGAPWLCPTLQRAFPSAQYPNYTVTDAHASLVKRLWLVSTTTWLCCWFPRRRGRRLDRNIYNISR